MWRREDRERAQDRERDSLESQNTPRDTSGNETLGEVALNPQVISISEGKTSLSEYLRACTVVSKCLDLNAQ